MTQNKTVANHSQEVVTQLPATSIVNTVNQGNVFLGVMNFFVKWWYGNAESEAHVQQKQRTEHYVSTRNKKKSLPKLQRIKQANSRFLAHNSSSEKTVDKAWDDLSENQKIHLLLSAPASKSTSKKQHLLDGEDLPFIIGKPDEFRVLPTIRPLRNGNFVITSQKFNSSIGYDGANLQTFDSMGVSLSDEISISDSQKSRYLHIKATSFSQDTFAVVLSKLRSDGASSDIFVQRYRLPGEKVGGEIQVNPDSAASQSRPEIITLSTGRLAVIWQGIDESSQGIYAQIFDQSGNKSGALIQVNTKTEPLSKDLAIKSTASQDGGFFVAWQSYQNDPAFSVIAVQQLDGQGSRTREQTLVMASPQSTMVLHTTPCITSLCRIAIA